MLKIEKLTVRRTGRYTNTLAVTFRDTNPKFTYSRKGVRATLTDCSVSSDGVFKAKLATLPSQGRTKSEALAAVARGEVLVRTAYNGTPGQFEAVFGIKDRFGVRVDAGEYQLVQLKGGYFSFVPRVESYEQSNTEELQQAVPQTPHRAQQITQDVLGSIPTDNEALARDLTQAILMVLNQHSNRTSTVEASQPVEVSSTTDSKASADKSGRGNRWGRVGLPKEQIDRIIKLSKTMTAGEVARKLNYSQTTVRRYIARAA
jgi:hypothetical protein